MLEKQQKRLRRHKRLRAKIKGREGIPRLCVFRSVKHICAQLIDDERDITLATANDQELKKSSRVIESSARERKIKKEQITKARKIAAAFEVGKLIAKKALEKKIEKVVFDRGGYKYHGRIKSLAEGAREGGLKF